MLIVGVGELGTNFDRAVGMIVVGCLGACAACGTPHAVLHAYPCAAAFLPGFYACYIMLGAALQWRGFAYSQIPQYDE